MAERLGLTVTEAQEKLTRAEFLEWLAYCKQNPSVADRVDYHGAMLSWLIARTMGGNKKAKPEDFRPQWSKDQFARKQERPENQDEINKALILGMFGIDPNEC